jgi:polar amino acid transport system substrate-binding protein
MRDTFNKVLDELTADGTLKNISNKWFGQDLTSNLQVPSDLDAAAMGTSSPAKNPFEGKSKLVIGVDNTYPPMEYTDDKNQIVGFDVDMANEIGKKLNLQVEFQSTSWDGIFIALKAKKFDCIISSCSINADRLKGYSMSKPYIANAQVIVTRA